MGLFDDWGSMQKKLLMPYQTGFNLLKDTVGQNTKSGTNDGKLYAGSGSVTGSQDAPLEPVGITDTLSSMLRPDISKAKTPADLDALINQITSAHGQLTSRNIKLDPLESYTGPLAKMRGDLAAQQAQDTATQQRQSSLDSLTKQLQGLNQGFQQNLQQIYPQQRQTLTDQINQMFVPQRQKAIAEEASLGRLTSPASIEPLSRLDTQKNLAQSQGLGQLSAQQAQGNVSLANIISGLMQQQNSLQQQGQQFGQTFGLEQQKFGQTQQMDQAQLDLIRQQLALSAQLGANQANASQPSLLQNILGGVSGVASAGAGFPGWLQLLSKFGPAATTAATTAATVAPAIL